MALRKLKIHRSWEERKYVSSRVQRFAKVWAHMLIKGEVDYRKACNVYKRNEAIPEATVKRLLRRKEVQNMILEEIDEILKKEGITPEFVIQKQKEVYAGAIKKEDYSNCNRVLESFRDMLNMNPSKVTITDSRSLTYNTQTREEKEQKMLESITVKGIRALDEPPVREE